MLMTEKELSERDAKRDLGAELLQAVAEMKAGKAARVTRVAVSPVAATRHKTGLSQEAFASLIGTSVRTVQAWEQGRREPTGAAKTLLRIAEQHPEYLRELAA